MVGPFHHEPIVGMDTCLRKQMVVTCSSTRVMLWNYSERKFLMAYEMSVGEEASSVAFHPSGFQILVCDGEKLHMLNVLSNRISEYHSI